MADTEIKDAFDTAFRDYPTDGVPSSGRHKVKKSEVRSAGEVVQEQFNNLSSLASSGRQPKEAVRIAITTNVTLSTLVNGFVTQGVTLATGNRIAPIGQTDQTENGIRIVQSSGTPIRATDADSGAELLGATFYVDEGTNAGKTYACSAVAPIVLGVTPLPFVLGGNDSAVVNKTVTGAGLADGSGDTIGNNPVIDVPKATDTSVLDAGQDAAAVTPYTVNVKFENDIGSFVTDERFAHVFARDPVTGVPLLALNYDGSLYVHGFYIFTSEEYETGVFAEDGTIFAALKWPALGGQWENGPFYEMPERLENAVAYIDDGKVYALTDRVVQLTFGDVTPAAPEIDRTDAVYRTIDGGIVKVVREDLLAENSLADAITKVNGLYGLTQSLGIGRESLPALTTDPPEPDRIVMHNVGVRILGNGQTSTYVDTPVARGDLVEWVPAYEQDQSTSGETPFSGMAIRLADNSPSDEAFVISATGIGGVGYAQMKKGTVPYSNLIACIKRDWIMCQTIGVDFEASVTVILGQNDRNAASGVFQGYLEEYQSDITADVQAIVPGHGEVVLYVSQLANYTAPGYDGTFSYVPDDIDAAARDNPDKIVLVGPEYTFQTAADGVHLINEASRSLGDMHAGARLRYRDNEPSCFRAMTAVRTGATIVVTCEVPVPPIILNPDVTDPAGDAGIIAGVVKGLRYANPGAPSVTISTITPGSTTLTIVLSSNPGAYNPGEILVIGMDGASGAAGGPTTGPRTCFCDSDPGTHPYGNRANPLSMRILPVTV